MAFELADGMANGRANVMANDMANAVTNEVECDRNFPTKHFMRREVAPEAVPPRDPVALAFRRSDPTIRCRSSREADPASRPRLRLSRPPCRRGNASAPDRSRAFRAGCASGCGSVGPGLASHRCITGESNRALHHDVFD